MHNEYGYNMDMYIHIPEGEEGDAVPAGAHLRGDAARAEARGERGERGGGPREEEARLAPRRVLHGLRAAPCASRAPRSLVQQGDRKREDARELPTVKKTKDAAHKLWAVGGEGTHLDNVVQRVRPRDVGAIEARHRARDKRGIGKPRLDQRRNHRALAPRRRQRLRQPRSRRGRRVCHVPRHLRSVRAAQHLLQTGQEREGGGVSTVSLTQL